MIAKLLLIAAMALLLDYVSVDASHRGVVQELWDEYFASEDGGP